MNPYREWAMYNIYTQHLTTEGAQLNFKPGT
jgi:hypothetical protein